MGSSGTTNFVKTTSCVVGVTYYEKVEWPSPALTILRLTDKNKIEQNRGHEHDSPLFIQFACMLGCGGWNM